MAYSVLVVEDEELIGEMVKLNLEEEGYEVSWITDGNEVGGILKSRSFDLIVLDIMLPGRDGFQIAGELRASEVGTPILMLTALSETVSRVKGLDAGGDDYLTKPFDMDEFLARVRALIRRSQGKREIQSSRLVTIGGHKVNLETREARTKHGKKKLSEKEVNLVELFLRYPGRTLTRADILDEVWGMDATPTERTVDNYIVELRKLFEKDPERPSHILTVHSQGYRYEP